MKKGEKIKKGERDPIPVGTRFGKLTTIEEAESIIAKNGYNKKTNQPILTSLFYYKCKCDCGGIKMIKKTLLVRKMTASCGCTELGKREHKGIPRWLIRMFKSQADVKGKKWELEIKYLGDLFEKQNGKCIYTGWDLDVGKNKKSKTASLDRIDSSKGYIKDNVQWVHKEVNIAKNSLSHERFLELCKAVAEKNKQYFK